MQKAKWIVGLTAICTGALAFGLVGCGEESKTPSEGLYYEKIDGKEEYAFSDVGTCTDLNIVIASEYNGCPVTEIEENALKNEDELRSVYIPDSAEIHNLHPTNNYGVLC